MIKKILIILMLCLPLANCTNLKSDLKELNERAKGDGVPYIPGV